MLPQPLRRSSLLTLIALVTLLTPLAAEAQRRAAPRSTPPREPTARQVIVIRGIAYPRYVYFQRGDYPGPYGYAHPYGDPRAEFSSAVRIEVRPSHAQVFVDGYHAGEVDEFDNVFQRLRLQPGGHEIAIYLDGYRTMRRTIYARPGETERIRGELQPLRPGEISQLPAPAVRSGVDRPGPRPLGPRPAPAFAFGTLALRVQPGDAEIFVDGERWAMESGRDRMAIRLPEGRHRLEVRRSGYARYVEDILIRRNATLNLNVSLRR